MDAISCAATGTNDGSMCPSDVRICSASCACSSAICISSPVGGVPAAPPLNVSRLGAFLSDSDGGSGGGPSSLDGRASFELSCVSINCYIFFPTGPCAKPAFLPLPPLFLPIPTTLLPCLVAMELAGEPPTTVLAILFTPSGNAGPGLACFAEQDGDALLASILCSELTGSARELLGRIYFQLMS